MLYPQTERQAHFVTIAQELATKFAARAPIHDRDGTFPMENYNDIRAAGLPSLVIPKKYGGWGGTLLETLMAMEVLAIGDGSTALNLTMHMQTMGHAAQNESWPEPLFAKVCREAVERGALINAVATEPELGSPSHGGIPKTTAQPVYENSPEPTGWIINGRKNFASMSPTLDYMIIPAALQDGSGKVARFVVPNSEQIEIIETWDAMGMRCTGSHDIVLHDAYVPQENMITLSNSAAPTSKSAINAWFMLIVNAVYIGVAMAAQQTAVTYAKERVPTALGKPIAELESIQRHLGQAELLLQQARIMLYELAERWDRYPEQRNEMPTAINVAKYTASNNAITAVDHCMRVVGGSSLSKTLPIERYYRDVRGGLHHPINDDQLLTTLGRLALSR